MRAALLAFAVVFASSTVMARAEFYPASTPPPRSTDPSVLTEQGREREIHERFNRGIAAQGRGEWEVAAAEFRRIIALDPPEPRGSTARYDLAISEAQLGRYDSAAALLGDALHRDPRFAAAAANLVTVELMRGDLGAARAAADRFVAIAPDAALARYGQGITALRAGDLATARDDFRALAEANPAYAVAHYDLALIELRAGHDDVALAELDRALTLSPSYARARFALGTVLLRDGRRGDARVAFDRCARDAADPTLRALAIDLRDKL